jgi:hypothetical protein
MPPTRWEDEPVRMVPYESDWAARFEQERLLLLDARRPSLTSRGTGFRCRQVPETATLGHSVYRHPSTAVAILSAFGTP